MSHNKKVNPNRLTYSYRDVQNARIEGAEFMFTVIVHVLKDKLEVGNDKLIKLGPHIDYFCDSIRKGFVKYPDLRKAQADEGTAYILGGNYYA